MKKVILLITISIIIGGVTMLSRKYYFKSDCTNDKVITDETDLIKEDEIDDVAKVSNNSINTHIDKYLRLNDFE